MASGAPRSPVPGSSGSGSGFELGTDGPRVIVVGVDGSESSFRAGAYAAGLARRQGARLVAVWVLPQGSPADLFAETAAVLADARQEEVDRLGRMVEWGKAYYGIPSVTLVTPSGDPFRELSRVAEEEQADAVVVGASEHAGHRIVGSLGLRLVRAGRWPITVVP
jgi:nucleotide-binding universal stress UspA family protein